MSVLGGSDSTTKVSDSHDDNRIGASDSAFVFAPKLSVGKKGKGTFNYSYTPVTTVTDGGAFDLVGQLITRQSAITADSLDLAHVRRIKDSVCGQTLSLRGVRDRERRAGLPLERICNPAPTGADRQADRAGRI